MSPKLPPPCPKCGGDGWNRMCSCPRPATPAPEKHVVKSWLGNKHSWVWQCGHCNEGGWTKEWALAWHKLEGHVQLAHLRRYFQSMYAKFNKRY